jgi:hypothetical protein
MQLEYFDYARWGGEHGDLLALADSPRYMQQAAGAASLDTGGAGPRPILAPDPSRSPQAPVLSPMAFTWFTKSF